MSPQTINRRTVKVHSYNRHSTTGRLHHVDAHQRTVHKKGRKIKKERRHKSYTLRDDQGYFRGSLIT